MMEQRLEISFEDCPAADANRLVQALEDQIRETDFVHPVEPQERPSRLAGLRLDPGAAVWHAGRSRACQGRLDLSANATPARR